MDKILSQEVKEQILCSFIDIRSFAANFVDAILVTVFEYCISFLISDVEQNHGYLK
jgi:dimeric dUTPase (all-alpha-NTP-PPase superfamily)